MFITRKTDYAIRCILYLSKDLDRIATVEEISKAVHVPKTFMAKILQQLMKAGIAGSVRGIKGGFQLARNPEDINLLEVIEAIQGPSAANICALDKKACSLSGTCAVHTVWVELREEVNSRLKSWDFGKLTDRENRLSHRAKCDKR
ncbi:MAG: Rrf2 family transcriptional regulator [Nitrospirae bacterium]|nr:Rrf2 family transcriptional regulator [Nitrospirota bacterium]